MSEKLAYNLSEDSITIFYDGKPYTIRKDNANFSALRSAIFEGRYDDVPELLDVKKAIQDFVEGDVEVRDEVLYYKGTHKLRRNQPSVMALSADSSSPEVGRAANFHPDDAPRKVCQVGHSLLRCHRFSV